MPSQAAVSILPWSYIGAITAPDELFFQGVTFGGYVVPMILSLVRLSFDFHAQRGFGLLLRTDDQRRKGV
ncbi:uncharacterized protein P174DRAFT_439434 [Aspergillus novofumigatus IBT 16806]|uniref:Uncharacterized protein n=1 Tax=Aspergillus novofumigatus (strain IBT 16806) TaxID=1392255 RepID=A0A2I1CJ65_ASPN1|nr:uncharacterized protein P174DRAFT_439434 [Aspergillus novofumigatus IBT 16806]PKX97666.1 hypothetical protein P174DRAFT_439434 [Aspergillus novofumigatus IBT 16806]